MQKKKRIKIKKINPITQLLRDDYCRQTIFFGSLVSAQVFFKNISLVERHVFIQMYSDLWDHSPDGEQFIDLFSIVCWCFHMELWIPLICFHIMVGKMAQAYRACLLFPWKE